MNIVWNLEIDYWNLFVSCILVIGDFIKHKGRTMKEFIVGLIFILGALVLFGLGFLFYPFLLILGFALRIFIIIALAIFFIWLLGKFIIFVWESLRKEPKP